MSAAPKLQFIEATETSISVQFTTVANSVAYILQWRPHSSSWSASPATKTMKGTKAEAENLEPGTTYCLRLVHADGSGEPGPDLIVDTEQVGCTPKAEKGCCVVS